MLLRSRDGRQIDLRPPPHAQRNDSMKALFNRLRGKRMNQARIGALIEAGWNALRSGDPVLATQMATLLDSDGVAQLQLRLAVAVANGDAGSAKSILNLYPALDQDARIQSELGRFFASRRQFKEAEGAFRASLAINSTYTPGIIGLSRLLLQRKRIAEALQAIMPLLTTGLERPEAIVLASEIYRALGRCDDAIHLLESCISEPAYPESFAVALATCYEQVGRRAAAIELAQRWLSQNRGSTAMRRLMGELLGRDGRFDEAQKALEQVLLDEPRNSAALNSLGEIQRSLGRYDEALENFQLARHQDSSLSIARVSLIAELVRAGHIDEARLETADLLAREPENSDGWYWEGNLADRANEIDVAANAYERAVSISPGLATCWTNLGLVRLRQGRDLDAIACQRRALEIVPNSAAVNLNLGLALQSAGDILGAIDCYMASRNIDPNDRITSLHIAIARLTAGDFALGWDDYEHRWLRETASQRWPRAPQWNGEPLNAKRLLIWGEQGLGDQIMFASCIEEVAKPAAECVIECNPRLAPLFARSFPKCKLVAGTSQADLDQLCSKYEIDVQTPIGSLPRMVRRSMEQFPRHTGYLVPSAEAQHKWRTRLAALPGRLKVGISWIGGAPITRQRLRSQALASWSSILTLNDIDFVSLQYTHCADELATVRAEFEVNISHWQDAIDDFDQTAALVSQLDLVISVCTTVVHLAGALNVPAWVMTPASPEWRYLNRGTGMPWYPSIVLFRQSKPNDWSDVIGEVKTRLEANLALLA